MSNIELLKQELINQKTKLTNKGYTVQTTYQNPSPSEITNALDNLSPKLSETTTATESDVSLGKTCYNNEGILITGTSVGYEDVYKATISGETTFEVKFPAGITKIRSYAFYNSTSTPGLITGTVNIPEGVTIIGPYAFYKNLFNYVSFPSTLTKIDTGAFNYSALLTLTIPDNITTISSNAFANASKLASLTLGSGLTALASGVFSSSKALTSVEIPANITSIETNNFTAALALQNIYIRGSQVLRKSASTFTGLPSSVNFWFNFEDLPYYVTATNWTTNKSRFISEVSVTSSSFPTLSGVTLTWYSNLTDANNKSNAITAPSGNGNYYCRVS